MADTRTHFRGRYDFAIDNKGRVNVPAKFRKMLKRQAADTFVLCQGPDDCLRAYPKNAWEEDFEKELASRPRNEETLRLRRLLNNTVTDSELDDQGRIALSALQMKIASISKSVTLLGQGDFIEIWDTEKFEKIIEDKSGYKKLFFDPEDGGFNATQQQHAMNTPGGGH